MHEGQRQEARKMKRLPFKMSNLIRMSIIIISTSSSLDIYLQNYLTRNKKSLLLFNG
jgi:hypothetical protein